MKFRLLILLILTGCNLKQLVIQADEIGVTDTEILEPGLHTVNSKTVIIYSIKEISINESVTLLSKDGKSFSGEFHARCYPDKNQIMNLHKSFGPQFLDIVFVPETRASIRQFFFNINSDSLTTIDIKQIESSITNDLDKVLKDKYLNLTTFVVKGLLLPADLQITKDLNLDKEYIILKTSKNWTDKQKAIDSFLKSDSKDALKILLQIYTDDKDQRTRDYILDNLRSSYR